MVTTKQITAANVNEQIKLLYQTAFPEDEQVLDAGLKIGLWYSR